MRSLSLGAAAAALFLVYGCGSKPSDTPATETGKPAAAESGGVSELKKEDTVVGKGPTVEAGDQISVRYTGKLTSGEVFDSNVDNGKPAFNLEAGPGGGVIEGWKQGLLGMKQGGKRKLSIPWKMAYGEAGSPPKIPPKADLIFDIEVLSVLKKGDVGQILRKITKPGAGRAAKKGDTVTIAFEGKTLDGKVIDKGSSFSFPLGAKPRRVMKGIEAAVTGMKVGSECDVTIPPEYALEYRGKGDVPGDATLQYHIKVVSIK